MSTQPFAPAGPIFPTLQLLYPLNSQIILIQGLLDELSGDYLDGTATVSATLLDDRGNPDPILQNLAMAYLDGTNGNYQGVVPATFNPPLGSGYTLQITATQGDAQSVWSIPAKVQLRRE